MQAESGGANFEDHALSSPTLISFDESGFTGPNLLRDDQPVFAYAAVELSIEEANQLIAEIRDGRKPVIQAAELKASGLRKRKDWPEIAGLVLSRMEGRYSFLVADKRLAFAGKVFEYLMEPVLEDNSLLFYRHGLHRLVAGAVYRSIATAGGPAEDLALQLETFMRSFDPADAPGSSPRPERRRRMRGSLARCCGSRGAIPSGSRRAPST